MSHLGLNAGYWIAQAKAYAHCARHRFAGHKVVEFDHIQQGVLLYRYVGCTCGKAFYDPAGTGHETVMLALDAAARAEDDRRKSDVPEERRSPHPITIWKVPPDRATNPHVTEYYVDLTMWPGHKFGERAYPDEFFMNDAERDDFMSSNARSPLYQWLRRCLHDDEYAIGLQELTIFGIDALTRFQNRWGGFIRET